MINANAYKVNIDRVLKLNKKTAYVLYEIRKENLTIFFRNFYSRWFFNNVQKEKVKYAK